VGGKMKKSIKLHLINQAMEILRPYVCVTGYTVKIEEYGHLYVDIIFTNSEKKEIGISNVWFNEETGEILQYGNNAGRMML
jgi:hypothetical protein